MAAKPPWTAACDADLVGEDCANFMYENCNTGYTQPMTCIDDQCYYDQNSPTKVYRSALLDPTSGCSAWYYATSLRGTPMYATSISDAIMNNYCSSGFGKFTPECTCLNFMDYQPVYDYCQSQMVPGTDPSLCEVPSFLISSGAPGSSNETTVIQFNQPKPVS